MLRLIGRRLILGVSGFRLFSGAGRDPGFANPRQLFQTMRSSRSVQRFQSTGWRLLVHVTSLMPTLVGFGSFVHWQ